MRRVVIVDYSRPAIMPEILRKRIVNRFGYAVFGSRGLDFETLGGLARQSRVSDL